MHKAFKFRAYPNSQQQVLFAKTFGCVRFIYNLMLSDKIKHYEETGQRLNNTPAQYKKQFEWLREVDSLALSNAQLHLQAAYNNFFNNPKSGFPKFKSKHRTKKSYTTNCINNNIVIADSYLKLPKIGMLKIKQHRRIPDNYRLKAVTISQSASGKYYVSILFEYDADISPVKPASFLGLDFSMMNSMLTARAIALAIRGSTDRLRNGLLVNRGNYRICRKVHAIATNRSLK